MNRRKSRIRAIMGSPVALVLALVILIIFARAAAGIHAKADESATKLAEAQANLARLQANQGVMQSKIADLSTEAGVEESIREKYHAVQPGESVVVIVDSDSDQNAVAASATTTATTKQSWWSRFWSSVF